MKSTDRPSVRLLFVSGCFAAVVATACAALPAIPVVVDPNRPEIDGVEVTQEQFLSRYCRGQSDSKTCFSVVEALAVSSARSSRAPR